MHHCHRCHAPVSQPSAEISRESRIECDFKVPGAVHRRCNAGQGDACFCFMSLLQKRRNVPNTIITYQHRQSSRAVCVWGVAGGIDPPVSGNKGATASCITEEQMEIQYNSMFQISVSSFDEQFGNDRLMFATTSSIPPAPTPPRGGSTKGGTRRSVAHAMPLRLNAWPKWSPIHFIALVLNIYARL